MKKKIRSITIYLLTGAVLAVMVGYMRTSYRHETYRLKAGEVLTQVLQQEMLSCDIANLLFNSKLTESMNEELPDTVRGRIRSVHGLQSYVVPRTKYYDNISASKIVRDVHSYLILESVLKADSLYKSWSRLLSDSSVCNHNIGLRLKQPLSGTTSYVPDSITVTRYDSLCTRYIGSYCEAEITVFSDISWYDLLEWTDWGLIFLAGGGVPCLCLFLVRLKKLYKSLSTLRKIKAKIHEEDVEMNVDVDKLVEYKTLLGGMERYKKTIIRLGNGYFEEKEVFLLDAQHCEIRLSNNELKLLQYLLKDPSGRMKKNELIQIFWPKISASSATTNLRTTVSRLREKLGKVNVGIESRGEYYCLIALEDNK